MAAVYLAKGIDPAGEIYVDDYLPHLNRQRFSFGEWIILGGLLNFSLGVGSLDAL